MTDTIQLDPETEEIALHTARFGLMVDFAKKNGIRKFGYGDVPGGGHSVLGAKIVVLLYRVYGEDHIDYTNEHIFYD